MDFFSFAKVGILSDIKNYTKKSRIPKYALIKLKIWDLNKKYQLMKNKFIKLIKPSFDKIINSFRFYYQHKSNFRTIIWLGNLPA